MGHPGTRHGSLGSRLCFSNICLRKFLLWIDGVPWYDLEQRGHLVTLEAVGEDGSEMAWLDEGEPSD